MGRRALVFRWIQAGVLNCIPGLCSRQQFIRTINFSDNRSSAAGFQYQTAVSTTFCKYHSTSNSNHKLDVKLR
jgi:hypothetical protein